METITANAPAELITWMTKTHKVLATGLQNMVETGEVDAPESREEALAIVDRLTLQALVGAREHNPTIWALYAEHVRQGLLAN